MFFKRFSRRCCVSRKKRVKLRRPAFDVARATERRLAVDAEDGVRGASVPRSSFRCPRDYVGERAGPSARRENQSRRCGGERSAGTRRRDASAPSGSDARQRCCSDFYDS